VNEDIFVRVVAMDKTVSISDIEPFHLSSHRRGQDFSVGLRFNVLISRLVWLGLICIITSNYLTLSIDLILKGFGK